MKNRWIVTVLALLVSTPVRGADLFNKSYAVVIGISSYKNQSAWKTLTNAENDAEAIDKFLTEQGFKVQRFVGQQATRGNIIAYLEDSLAPILTANDRFIFYFSGHGNTKPLGGRDRGYLIPYDGDTEKASTWIAMEQLQELADKLGNARHQLFILDACFGGLFATKSSKSSIPANTPNYIAEMTDHRARQYLTAGGTNEETPASSNVVGYMEYSHYTAYLLKGLRGGAADRTKDGFITVSELNEYLEEAASTKYNTPRGGNFPGHEQGNFVFRSPHKGDPPILPPPPPPDDIDRNDWERLSKKGEEGLKSYLLLHPDGKWADEARKRLREFADPPNPPETNSQKQAQAIYEWQHDIIKSTNSATVEQFLQRYPVGSHVSDAKRKLEELRARGK